MSKRRRNPDPVNSIQPYAVQPLLVTSTGGSSTDTKKIEQNQETMISLLTPLASHIDYYCAFFKMTFIEFGQTSTALNTRLNVVDLIQDTGRSIVPPEVPGGGNVFRVYVYNCCIGNLTFPVVAVVPNSETGGNVTIPNEYVNNVTDISYSITLPLNLKYFRVNSQVEGMPNLTTKSTIYIVKSPLTCIGLDHRRFYF